MTYYKLICLQVHIGPVQEQRDGGTFSSNCNRRRAVAHFSFLYAGCSHPNAGWQPVHENYSVGAASSGCVKRWNAQIERPCRL
jgi:hypothetical protein